MQSYYALLLIGHNEKRVAMNRKCEWNEKEMIFEKISREEEEEESKYVRIIYFKILLDEWPGYQ